MSTHSDGDDVQAWASTAERWIATQLPHRAPGSERASLALFHDLDDGEERVLIDRAKRWQRTKFLAGYGAITADPSVGGRGLSIAHLRAFERIERRYDAPEVTEIVPVSLDLVAPTLALHGSPQQQDRFVAPILRGDTLVCQLFSEPDAGSDLAGLTCAAVRHGDRWLISGQKVWTSGAHLADHGLMIARTDAASKHGGLTAFLVPMRAPGVTVRPIRQMSGGSAFNEVFLDDVELEDDARVDDVGRGWAVALTTLQLERAKSGSGNDPGGGFDELLATARRAGRTGEATVRNLLARAFIAEFVQDRVAEVVVRQGISGTVTAEGSLIKLLWIRSLTATSRAASMLAGPHLTADAGDAEDPGDRRFEWGSHVLGAPGYRIAGGTDEIQRTIIGERLLGLPREPAAAPRAVTGRQVERE